MYSHNPRFFVKFFKVMYFHFDLLTAMSFSFRLPRHHMSMSGRKNSLPLSVLLADFKTVREEKLSSTLQVFLAGLIDKLT